MNDPGAYIIIAGALLMGFSLIAHAITDDWNRTGLISIGIMRFSGALMLASGIIGSL